MRSPIHILCTLGLCLFVQQAAAQCQFDPTISPNAPILCPNTQEVLTTQVYDAYQWYKDGSPITGATEQTYTVDAYADAGSQFNVQATLAGCTELSPEILVDGWVFLPPTVMTVADTPVGFTPDYTLYCEDANVMLVMQQPYDTNIQWTNMGTPVPGATNDTLVVTENGQYSASGAPSICPDLVQQLGVQIGVYFFVPTQPDIVPSGTELCAYPAGFGYQWYLDEQPIADSDTLCIEASVPGVYTVSVDYQQSCTNASEPYLVTGIIEAMDTAPIIIGPQPAHDQITVTWADGTAIKGWHMLDAMGRVVLQEQGTLRSPLIIDLQQLGNGRYWLQTPGRAGVPVMVVK